MWLVAATTNNEPCVTAHHFVSFMQQIRGLLLLTRHIACTLPIANVSGVPRCIRLDRGTENVLIGDIQKALRWGHRDSASGPQSYLYGSSHRNQASFYMCACSTFTWIKQWSV